ncbi:MAG: hypothetical protein AAB663_02890 [Patescibacteria group bacterium]
MKVLVIEDVPGLAHYMTKLLTTCGFSPHHAATPSGAQAMLIADGPFDAVIIDPLYDEGGARSGLALYDRLRTHLITLNVFMVGETHATITEHDRVEMHVRGITYVPLHEFNPATQLR